MTPAPVRAVLVMGVSGAGKTTIGRALSARLGWRFIEGDDLHSPENIAKMRAGIALTDADRWPWLDRVADALRQAADAGGGVVACSALRRAYRDRIRARLGVPLLLVHPMLAVDAIRGRIEHRTGHFMPVSLLDSQVATLEPPGADEGVVTTDATLPPAAQVAAIVARLSPADAPGSAGPATP